GEVPRDMESLVKLPGVARKTANVVLGTALGIAAGIVVDTHVHRLAVRMGLVPLQFAKRTQTNSDKVEQALMDLFPQDKWVFVGHALILHGRQICTAKAPACDHCSLNEVCLKRL
ncbi:MAG: endonuclease III domain-containing protein, partial [Candidatus Zipacnadales bacterium]